MHVENRDQLAILHEGYRHGGLDLQHGERGYCLFGVGPRIVVDVMYHQYFAASDRPVDILPETGKIVNALVVRHGAVGPVVGRCEETLARIDGPITGPAGR